MLFSVASALALGAVMTAGDWLRAALRIRNGVGAGIAHGAVMCLCVAFAIGVRAGRRASAALAGPVIGAIAAGTYYLLTPVLGRGGMFPAWMLLWLLFAALQWRLMGDERIGTAGKRGLLAAALSGLAFYLVADIWIHGAAHRGLLVHLAAWTFAFLPGFASLFAALPAEDEE